MSTARGIITGPQPTDATRRWGIRLRLYRLLLAAVQGFDADAFYTIAALGLVGAGVAVVAGIGWALVVVGLLVSLLSPLGNAIRLFVRGK